MLIIPGNWCSQRLSISNLQENEITLVQDIYQTSSYMNQWDGQKYDEEHIKKCFYKGNLPPEGKMENYRVQTIKTNEDQEIIGILSSYYGYPTVESVYLEFLYIERNIQKKGYGQEVINQFTEVLSKHGYKEIRINVSIKNWSALRYWIKTGFNQVIGIYGDKEHSENTFANIELKKIL